MQEALEKKNKQTKNQKPNEEEDEGGDILHDYLNPIHLALEMSHHLSTGWGKKKKSIPNCYKCLPVLLPRDSI